MADEIQTPNSFEDDDVTPRGTLFVMVVYIMVLAGMWGVLYFTMINR